MSGWKAGSSCGPSGVEAVGATCSHSTRSRPRSSRSFSRRWATRPSSSRPSSARVSARPSRSSPESPSPPRRTTPQRRGSGSGWRRPSALAQQIVGTWIAVSQYVDQDGKKLEPFGSNPKGMVVYDSNGRFILVLQRATLPKFASNNRMTGTPEENRAIVQGSIAYFGRYSIDESNRKINLRYDGSTYPNWDGEDQARLIELSGDELKIISPVLAVGGGIVHLVLRRVR